MVDITIAPHLYFPDQQVIEITNEHGLVVTIIPKADELVIVSKYIQKVIQENEPYPPKVLIKLKE